MRSAVGVNAVANEAWRPALDVYVCVYRNHSSSHRGEHVSRQGGGALRFVDTCETLCLTRPTVVSLR